MSKQIPLYILAVCSGPLIDEAGNPIILLDVDEERRRIEAGVRGAGDAARVHFLPEATTSEVQAELREGWDVVHFTGHGTSDGRLLLEDGCGVAHLLSKEETIRLFTAHRTPLVVLSACYSETVGSVLHEAGVPAVVAVDARVPIADLAAIIFAEHFYSALAHGWEVGRAFEEAQRAVALDSKVGDARPPLDIEGNPEEPWSHRFKLIGAAGALAAGSVTRRETQARPRVAGNVPEGSVNFVGRAAEIVDVVRAFDESDARRVCVYGAGGLGKTELAKAVARWYAERARVGAMLWASASHVEDEYKLRDLASLLGIVARLFNLPVSEQSLFEEQKRVVREFLVEQHALVLLDNWETIEPPQRRELWAFMLSLPEPVRVLVTSRDVLPPQAARNIELDTLTPDDAVDLFVNVARNTGYFDRNPNLDAEEFSTLHTICERLSGYPLAIEVVAGQTFSRTLAEIWNDLQNLPQKVLEGRDEITGEPRGVWTSLGLSYDALSGEEKKLFCQLSILLSPANAEDVGAITQSPNSRTLLDTLVKRSLVRMRGGGYSLLPIVRYYAEGKLADAGQDPRELHLRAVSHYGEKETVEAALTASDHLFELASRYNSHEAARAFIGYVPTFYYVMERYGYWAEARAKNSQMIAVARAVGEKKIEAQAMGELGKCYYKIGEYEHATELYRKVISLAREVGDKNCISDTLHQLGIVALTQGDYDEAERLYRESLKMAEESGDDARAATTLHELGRLAQARRDDAEAERLYRQSLELKRGLDEKGGIATTLYHLGLLAQQRDDYEEAERLYNESLDIEREIGNKNGEAISLHQFGRLYVIQGRMKEALGCLLQAYVIYEKLQVPYRHNALADIAALRDTIGDEQFLAWLGELTADAERISELLERKEVDEKLSKDFAEWLAAMAQSVVAARRQGGAEAQATLAQQLAKLEAEARKHDATGIADFLAVLRGLLTGEEIGAKLAALDEPFKGVAEQTLAACQ